MNRNAIFIRRGANKRPIIDIKIIQNMMGCSKYLIRMEVFFPNCVAATEINCGTFPRRDAMWIGLFYFTKTTECVACGPHSVCPFVTGPTPTLWIMNRLNLVWQRSLVCVPRRGMKKNGRHVCRRQISRICSICIGQKLALIRCKLCFWCQPFLRRNKRCNWSRVMH
jgi:hypothetical protein